MIKISILIFMVSILCIICSSYYNTIDIVEQTIQNQFTKIFHNQTILIASIQFKVPPNIEGPEQELVNETISNPVTFACDATGIPPPTLVWLKDGKPIGNILSRSFCSFSPLWGTTVLFAAYFLFLLHLSLGRLLR